MFHVIFTLDYEIHGNGDGSPRELMVDPTDQLLRLLEAYGAKLTIMADVAEILKFREYRDRTGRDDYAYEAIAGQLRDAIRRGHDVQLHLHPSYFNARHEDGRWIQDWSEYDFARLPANRLEEIVRLGKTYLEDLLRPVSTDYACVAFRAANWAAQPSRNVVRALVNNGILIDTSVFKYGRRDSLVQFDYSHAPSALVPWRVDESDVCVRNDSGPLLEIPIYCESRWLGAFVTPNRIYRAAMTRAHPVGMGPAAVPGAVVPPRPSRGLLGRLPNPWKKYPWKADFNQCTGRQLVRAINRAWKQYDSHDSVIPFVLIGHSKQFNRANERSLEPFLRYVSRDKERFGFSGIAPFAPRSNGSEASPQRSGRVEAALADK